MADELLDVAIAAARAAAPGLLERFEHGVQTITAKSTATDLVSEADHAAEDAIRAVLGERRPDDGVLGEEGDDVAGTTGKRWVVDPLDGTINFLFGIPQWCISVACEDLDGGDAVGVVLDPVRDELFAIGADGVPTLNEQPIRASTRDDLGQALVATGFAYDAAVREKQAAIVARVIPRVRDVRRAGAAALDLAWCAAGRLDGYYELGVQPWDIGAGMPLCRAAGLTTRTLEARDGLPGGVLVAPAAIAGALHELVVSPPSGS